MSPTWAKAEAELSTRGSVVEATLPRRSDPPRARHCETVQCGALPTRAVDL